MLDGGTNNAGAAGVSEETLGAEGRNRHFRHRNF
jgi:hypothetical protein